MIFNIPSKVINNKVSYIITQANNIYQHILKSRFMYLFYPIMPFIYLCNNVQVRPIMLYLCNNVQVAQCEEIPSKVPSKVRRVPLKNGGPNSIRGNTQLSVRTESFDWPK